MCSKAEWFRGQTRWTGALRPPFRATASSLARAGNVELDRYLQLMLPGVQIRYYARPQIELTSATCVVHGQRSERWITGLAGSSSSWELRAGRTGPTVKALPRLQTATIKRCENASASVILNYRSLPVGPQRGKDDRREYVRGGGLHGGYAPPWGSAVPRTSGLAEPSSHNSSTSELTLVTSSETLPI